MTTPAAFFDIGDTLGRVRLCPDGRWIEEIAALPGVVEVLTGLRDGGARLGILSHRGPIPARDVEAALRRAVLLEFFPEQPSHPPSRTHAFTHEGARTTTSRPCCPPWRGVPAWSR